MGPSRAPPHSGRELQGLKGGQRRGGLPRKAAPLMPGRDSSARPRLCVPLAAVQGEASGWGAGGWGGGGRGFCLPRAPPCRVPSRPPLADGRSPRGFQVEELLSPAGAGVLGSRVGAVGRLGRTRSSRGGGAAQDAPGPRLPLQVPPFRALSKAQLRGPCKQRPGFPRRCFSRVAPACRAPKSPKRGTGVLFRLAP